MNIQPGDLLRPAECAALLGCSTSHIYKLLHTGQLHHFRTRETGAVRVPGVAIEQLLTREIEAAVAERSAS
jgi:excisionase family DNA binding protein